MEAILESQNLKVQYGEIVAVENVNITIPKGECVGLIGPNGAGKTTLLKALSGVLPSVGGEIRFRGSDVTNKMSYEMARMGVGLIPEGRLPFASMPVRENLLLPAYSMKLTKQETNEQLKFVYSLFPRLQERSAQKAGSLSGGEQQMMVISRALMLKPQVLLIDEPSLGLAPIIVEQIYEVIPKLLDLDISILLVEQSSELALSVCSQIHVMKEGNIIHSDSANRLNKSELADFYLK